MAFFVVFIAETPLFKGHRCDSLRQRFGIVNSNSKNLLPFITPVFPPPFPPFDAPPDIEFTFLYLMITIVNSEFATYISPHFYSFCKLLIFSIVKNQY